VLDSPRAGKDCGEAWLKDVNSASSPIGCNKIEGGCRDRAVRVKGCIGLCQGYTDAQYHEAVHHFRCVREPYIITMRLEELMIVEN